MAGVVYRSDCTCALIGFKTAISKTLERINHQNSATVHCSLNLFEGEVHKISRQFGDVADEMCCRLFRAINDFRSDRNKDLEVILNKIKTDWQFTTGIFGLAEVVTSS